MKSKLISIPYTVGLIKPHIALQERNVCFISKFISFCISNYSLMNYIKSWIFTTLKYFTRRKRFLVRKKYSICFNSIKISLSMVTLRNIYRLLNQSFFCWSIRWTRFGMKSKVRRSSLRTLSEDGSIWLEIRILMLLRHKNR